MTKRLTKTLSSIVLGATLAIAGCGGGGDDPVDPLIDVYTCRNNQISMTEMFASEYQADPSVGYLDEQTARANCDNEPCKTNIYRVSESSWNFLKKNIFCENRTALDFGSKAEAQEYIDDNKPAETKYVTVWGCDGDNNPISWKIKQSVYDANPGAYNLNPIPCF